MIAIHTIIAILIIGKSITDSAIRKTHQYTTKLEEMVEDRTKELNSALVEMETMNKNLTLRQERTDKDIKIATNVQRGLCIKDSPQTNEWDTAYLFKPIAGVSGDLYDFYLKDGTLKGLSLFDISGHGIGAALITMLTKSIAYRNFMNMESFALGKVIEKINKELIFEIDSIDSFLTGIILRIDGSKVEYTNAAHTKMILKKAKNGNVNIVKPKNTALKGPILGKAELKGKFQTLTFKVEKGDWLLLYTDGLSEGLNGNNEMFGEQRLISVTKRTPDGSGREMLEFIYGQFKEFTGTTPAADDLTAILIKKR